ncbi:MAG TPA: ABC transporter substrate-binding protein, partial [Roseiflexaceae bacterium]|nr:ABC transporter substrate-binding protein [Roseiflexaceae bacterium]
TTPPVATAVPVAATKYKEAPMLAELVAAGKLPNVDERLPKAPYTPPHTWLSTGNYGGTMNFTNSWGPDGLATIVQESQYGHSILRWLDDGLKIGPGLAESWEANADTSEWTFKFREGLKWSDGQPWTVDDILYWWEYMVGGNGKEAEFPEGLKPIEPPPDEGRSGAGTLATLVKVDDYTLQMKFDAPAPLTADRLAMWVNAGIGPRWMAPRHYMEQFNPVLSPDKAKDFEEHQKKVRFVTNPDCPTMTGWKCESYEEGVRGVYVRNPYYWVVDKDGNQLPYIDRIVSTSFQDAEVEKLNVLQGKSDFTHHWVLQLTDVQNLREAASQGDFEVRFWDSGSGSGTAFFLSYDFQDDKMRELARMPKFRQALSHAFNRAEVQKVRYFGSGELTTGTFSPKAIEYNIDDNGNPQPANDRYKEWRDSYVAYDPEKAKALLDEIGVKPGADGMRTFPDGSPLEVLLVINAKAGKADVAQNEQMVRDWAQVGIKATISPVPDQGRRDNWFAGKLMSNADWGIGDGPNHLVYPQWLVPIEPERWAPLHGQGYQLKGTATEKEELDKDPWERTPARIVPTDKEFDPTIGKLHEIYDKTKVEPDVMKRHQLVWEMIKIHVESGPYVQGSVANFERVFIVKNGLKNVPKKEDLALGGFTDPWIHPTPAVYDPESWYWDDPSKHS